MLANPRLNGCCALGLVFVQRFQLAFFLRLGFVLRNAGYLYVSF